MRGGRSDFALNSRRLAICLVALAPWWASRAVGQNPPSVPAVASRNPVLPPGYSVPAGPVPSAPPTAPAAPVASSADVVEVRIEGNKSIPLHKIMPNIKTRVGRPLDKATVEDDVRRLTKTHQFINVDPRFERRADGGIVIVFRVVERPIIRYVKIYGSKTRESTLAKKAGLKVGDSLDPYAVEEARTKLEEYLHSKAYAQASVTILEGNNPGDRGVKLMINEGLKQKIWDVEFEGNTVAPDGRLTTQIQSKPPILYIFKGEVDYDRINEDVRRLTDYYRSLGYFRARIGREWTYNDKQNWMTLKFIIDEGPRYIVNSVSVIGNTKLETEKLTKDLKLKGGDPFDQATMTKDISGLQDKYGEVGYIFADVQSEPRFLLEPAKLDLVYKIEEGDRYRVGRINVKIGGENPHTRRTAVLNRLSLRTGDIANTKKLRDSERRLKASAMFANNAQQGQAPKIVFAKPGMEEEESDEVSVARKPKRGAGPGSAGGPTGGGGMNGMGFNGQSPDPEEQDNEQAADDDGEGLRDGETAEIEFIPIRDDDSPAGKGRLTVARPAFNLAASPAVVRAQSPAGAMTPVNRYAQPQSGYGQQPTGRTGPDAITGTNRAPAAGNQVIQTQYAQPPATGYMPPPGGTTPAYAAPPPANAYAAPGGYAQNAPPATYPQQPPAYAPPGGYAPSPGSAPVYGQGTLPPPNGPPLLNNAPAAAVASPNGYNGPEDLGLAGPATPTFDNSEPPRDIDISVMGNETQTGRLMLGVGVNSNAGLIGNITLDEQNFDWRRFPRSWEDIRNATAWRGGGQQFRIQASPGTVYQQYMINFHNPYLFDTPVSFGLSGSYFTRLYQNWTEKRLGGQISLGYQFLYDPNLSTVVSIRGENVNISNPTVPTPPQLEEVLGDNAFYSGKWQIIHDTRDSAFLATQGHRVSIGLEQAFGSFSFPRATIDASQHFLLHERPDTSGRHTLSLSTQTGFAGSNTPIYENFFAGGYTTLRGFYFRGASPLDMGVQVGGHFQFINSVEYMFPITGDDMLRGVAFTDFGTVMPNISMDWENFRVSPGLGLRVTVPAMGPAPIALDFAVPLHHAPGDQLQLFSFFIGVNR